MYYKGEGSGLAVHEFYTNTRTVREQQAVALPSV